MSDDAKVLGRAVNYAVVHLPGRRFPGVVVQGDSLNSLVRSLEEAISLARAGRISGAIDALECVREPLIDAQRHYELACAEAGTGLPYPMARAEIASDRMDADDLRRASTGVVVTLLNLGDGACRLILDDVRSEESQSTTTWKHEQFYTHKLLNAKDTEAMALTPAQYQEIGEVVMARLLALNGRIK